MHEFKILPENIDLLRPKTTQDNGLGLITKEEIKKLKEYLANNKVSFWKVIKAKASKIAKENKN